MHLISALAAGIVGATSGTAEIYARGTSTRVDYFTDFEGDGQVSKGTDVQLDANGGASIYVNQLVTIIAKDVQGEKVREWTAGDAAPNTEVRSLSYTGTDYGDTQRLAGLPTTLQSVLDLWKTSAGAIDWNVDVAGVSTSLKNAVGALGGLFFNVKSSEFGGIGDGVVDDTLAIAAALTAATAGGGIVFFPPGTYRVTAASTIPPKVSVWGAGVGSTFIDMDDSTASIFFGSVSVNGPQVIQGISFSANVLCTGNAFFTNVATNLLVRDCYFDGTALRGAFIQISSSDADVTVTGCLFDITSGTGQAALQNGSGHTVMDGGTRVNVTTSSNQTVSMVLIGNGTVTGCYFDDNSTGAGTYSGVEQNGGGSGSSVSVVGNHFLSLGNATFTGAEYDIQTMVDKFQESSNVFSGTITFFGGSRLSFDSDSQFGLSSRDGVVGFIEQTGTTTLQLDALAFGSYKIDLNNLNSFTFNITGFAQDGAQFSVVFDNLLGITSGVITYGTGIKKPSGGTFGGIPANGFRVIFFICRDSQWYVTSDSGNLV